MEYFKCSQNIGRNSISNMNRNLIFLVNPISGTKDKGALRKEISERTSEKNIPFRILETNAASDYSYLNELIISEKITDIIVCGGDGTINQVASSIRGCDVNVGIIPMGSGNGLAYAAGIPLNVSKALQVIYSGNASLIDSFLINGKFSCMLCGVGFDAQVAHDFAKQKKRGLGTYIRLSIRNFMIAPVYPFVLIEGETEIKTEAFFISIANSNQFGNNVRIAPKASLHDGLLDIVVVNKMSKLRMLFALVRQLKLGQVMPLADKKYHKKDIYYFQTKNIRIKNPGNAPLHIDGDPCESAPILDIRVIENAFRLLQPNL